MKAEKSYTFPVAMIERKFCVLYKKDLDQISNEKDMNLNGSVKEEYSNFLNERNADPAYIFNAMKLLDKENLGFENDFDYKRTRKNNNEGFTYVKKDISSMIDIECKIEENEAHVNGKRKVLKTNPVYLKIHSHKYYQCERILRKIKSQLPKDFYLKEVVEGESN